MQKTDRLTGIMKDAPSTSAAADWGLLILRLGLGFFFIYHGIGKFFGYSPDGGIEVFAGLLSGIGFPWPFCWAYLVAFVELFGGIVIALGFFTKAFSLLLAVISLISFALFANFSLGLTFGDVDVLSFTMSLALMISGPGKISFAERWYREDLLGIDSRTETFLLKSETPEVSEKTETEKTNTAKTQERKSEGRKE